MADVTNSKLLELDTGILKSQDACIVIIKTEWNADLTDLLEKGCRSLLQQAGVREIRTLTVPGAFEITFAIRNFWDKHKYKDDRPQAFIALGCVIRGDTPHFEYVCKAVTDGVLQLNLTLPVPTVFGVLTVDTMDQAIERTGGRHGHKGEEAAITALKMIRLMKSP
jgi:6,7-dimethyl-8-ribityllumazine synthase